jgi:hypothetical protein
MRVAQKLTLLILLALSTMAHGAHAVATSRLTVVIREQQELVRQGNNILFRVRLSPGVSAMVWVDANCTSPIENVTTITQSGSYLLPIASLQGRGNAYSCMVSSDGELRAAVPIR